MNPRLTSHIRRCVLVPLLTALVVIGGLVSIASPAQAEEEVTPVRSVALPGTRESASHEGDVAVGPDGRTHVLHSRRDGIQELAADATLLRTFAAGGDGVKVDGGARGRV